MIKTILHNLGLSRVIDYPAETRRAQLRRTGERAMITVGNKNYVVRDWSPSGLYFDADPGVFQDGESFRFTLKFKLDTGQTIDIAHEADVVRIEPMGVAARLKPYSAEVRRKFDRVAESQMAAEFSNSYVA